MAGWYLTTIKGYFTHLQQVESILCWGLGLLLVGLAKFNKTTTTYAFSYLVFSVKHCERSRPLGFASVLLRSPAPPRFECQTAQATQRMDPSDSFSVYLNDSSVCACVSCGRATQALHSARMDGSTGGSAQFYGSQVGTGWRGTAPQPTGESQLTKHGRGPCRLWWWLSLFFGLES